MWFVKPLAVTALTAAAALAPQDASQEQPDASSLRSSELEITYFRPEHSRAKDLAAITSDFQGRWLNVIDEDGTIRSVRNMTVMGDIVLVYDSKQATDRIVKQLTELDLASAVQNVNHETVVEAVQVRYLSLARIRMLVENFHGTDYSVIEDTVVLRGHRAEVQKTKDLLSRLDRPRPQVLLTAYLVTAVQEETMDPRLPSALTQNLKRLLPYKGLRMDSVAMLRSAVDPQGEMTILMQAEKDEDSGFLRMRTGSYDSENKTLSLEQCRYELMWGVTPGSTTLFETSTTVKAGEYTVLGASGLDPAFVVLHVVEI